MTSRAPKAAGSLGVVLAAMFVLAATNGIVFPLLAELQDTYDLPTWGLGAISAAAFAVGLVVQLSVAGLADRGHAKTLLLTGLAVAVVGGLVFAVGTQLWMFILGRALGGLSIGCFVPAARAIAATIDPLQPARHLGRLAGVELAGFVTGPVIAAVLAEAIGLKAPFVAGALLATVALVLLAPRPLPVLVTTGASSRPSLDLLRIRGVVVAALLALALFLPVGIYDSLWSRYLEDRGASTLFVGLSLTLYGVPFAAFSALGGRLADRKGPVRSALWGLVLIAPMTALYGLLATPVLIAGVALFEAVVQAVAVPAAQAAMAQATPKGRVAAGQGLAGATQLVGATTTALIAAPVYDALGPEVVFVGAAVAIALLGATAALLARRGPSTRNHSGTSPASAIAAPTPNAP